jgi:hypothetical protein
MASTANGQIFQIRFLGRSVNREDDDMSPHLQSSQRTSTALYRAVPGAAAVLLIWFIVAAWLVFAVADVIEPAPVLIGALAFMIIAKAAALWCAGAKARGPNRPAGETEPRDPRLRGEFSITTDLEKGSETAVPIAA